jgi:YhcH/YjgK/YiaL family protein
MGVTDMSNLKVTKDYDAEGDYLLFEGQGPMIKFTPGMFGLYMPHDAHMPSMALGEPAPAKKIVMKVRV